MYSYHPHIFTVNAYSEDMWIVKLQQLRFFIDKILDLCGKTVAVGKQMQVPLQWQCVSSVFLLSNCLDHFDDSK